MLARLFKKTGTGHRVSVSSLGVELEVPRDSTILEWALGRGIAFPHSCRVGTCGTCKCRLVSGKVYLFGEDVRERNAVSDVLMDVPVVICSVLGPVVLAAMAWKVGQGGLSPFAIAGMIASCAWLAVVPVVPALHELYHKRNPWKYALGTYAQMPYMDCGAWLT